MTTLHLEHNERREVDLWIVGDEAQAFSEAHELLADWHGGQVANYHQTRSFWRRLLRYFWK